MTGKFCEPLRLNNKLKISGQVSWSIRNIRSQKLPLHVYIHAHNVEKSKVTAENTENIVILASITFDPLVIFIENLYPYIRKSQLRAQVHPIGNTSTIND